MNFLKLNQRMNQPINKQWLALPLLMMCTFGAIAICAGSQAKALSDSQTARLIAQSNCSAADLSRKSPPFKCVTPKVFSCLKRNNAGGNGSLEYRGNTSGEIVVKSSIAGPVALLGFSFDSGSETLYLNVKKKNFAVQEQQIWDGFRSTLSKCR